MSDKLWGGRFSGSTDPKVEAFTASIHFDKALVFDDILGSLAHARMLAHCGIITPEEGELLQQGLQTIAQKAQNKALTYLQTDEDIHMNIERLLHQEIGDVAAKLHTARSRNDQVALDLHLYLRRQTVEVVALLFALQQSLINSATLHRLVILPGYTHLQRAQPVYLAQHWLAYAAMLERDIDRLKCSWQRLNQSPLGAGALCGSTFPIDKDYVANLLGFDGVYLNTMDAVSNRDFVIEFLAASTMIMMHLSRLSEELILWSSQEFNFISLDDAFCTGSSMMPQKKNPDVAELARGKTGRVYGALFTLLTLLKGLPLTYNRDLQEDKEPLFDTVNTLCSTLSVYDGLLNSLKINEDAMRAATENGFLNATALAEYLVKKGIGFRFAHEIAGKLVAHCLLKNCRLDDLALVEMREFSSLIEQDVYQALKPAQIALSHDNANCQGVSLMDVELMTRIKNLADTNDWIGEKWALLEEVGERFWVQGA